MPTNPDFVPSTVLEAVDSIVAGLAPDEIEYIKKQDSASVHFSTGMGLRNGWSLWEKETPLKKDAVKTYKISHADDVSGLILDWSWAKVRGEIFDPVAYCERFHKHWKECGETSLSAGGYNEDGTPMKRGEE